MVWYGIVMWCGMVWDSVMRCGAVRCGAVWCGAVRYMIQSGLTDLSCVTQLDHDDSEHALLAELGPDVYYMLPLTAGADKPLLQPDETEEPDQTEELADGQRILWQRDGKKEPQAATVRTRAGCAGDTSIAATKVLLLFSEPGESMMVRNARSHACARTVHTATHAAPVHTSSHRHTNMLPHTTNWHGAHTHNSEYRARTHIRRIHLPSGAGR